MLSLWEVQEKNTFSSLHTFLQKLLTIIRPLALTLRLSGAPRQALGGKRHPLLILVRLRLNRFCKQPLKACFLSSLWHFCLPPRDPVIGASWVLSYKLVPTHTTKIFFFLLQNTGFWPKCSFPIPKASVESHLFFLLVFDSNIKAFIFKYPWFRGHQVYQMNYSLVPYFLKKKDYTFKNIK